MGKKAKGDHTPEQPPLDEDALWMPLVEAIALLFKLAGSVLGALRRIEKAMRSGKLPSMREDLTTGKLELLQPGFWKANSTYYEDKEPRYASAVLGSRDELG